MSALIEGSGAAAVLDLLRARRARGREADDGRRLALIVEGGGMRGVLSAGSLLAIDLMGFRPCFDEVYATSAGAVNAAYFLSGQGEMGITVYFDSICNRRFYNPWRVHRMVDVAYVYDHIVPRVKPLDEAAIRRGPADLLLSLTDALTGGNVLFDVKRSDEPVARVLKASSALPVLYNRTVELDGRHYVDGGLTCGLPVRQAAARGCTDVLVLLTKGTDYATPAATRPGRLLLYTLMGRRYPGLMEAYGLHAARSREERRLATGAEPLEGVNVAAIAPGEAEGIVRRTTIARPLLLAGAHRMAARTYAAFDEDPAGLEPLFERYRAGWVEGRDGAAVPEAHARVEEVQNIVEP